MGAWSHDSFGNDSACDFAWDIAESNDLSVIEAALDEVVKIGDGYLEAPEASQAIAAVEAIARLQGNWGVRNAYSKDLDDWVERTKMVPSKELARKAKSVLGRITTEPSELLELWQEGGDGEDWIAAVRELDSRVVA